MDRITTEQLRALAEAAAPPCVSIYLPTHRTGRDTQGDPIRLKNLLKKAEDQLIQQGMRPTLARDLLEQAKALTEDEEFWLYSSDALALFLAEGFMKYFRLPIETDDLAIVNRRFHLKPILPLLSDNVFHILVLSLNDVRLLEGTPHRVERVELPKDVATSLSAAIGSKDHHVDRGLWRHGGGTHGQAQIGDVHGHGPDQDNEMQEHLAFYMRQIDEGVRRVIGEETPLIVAGADSTAPHFLRAVKRKNVLEQIIAGNHEHTPDETLQQKAIEILEPIWKQELNAVQERFGTAKSQGIASSDVVQILKAASEGRLDTLIVSPTAAVWGDFDEDKAQAQARDGGPEDLIELAVQKTILTSGTVVVTDEGNVPGNREAAAIYRY